MNMKDLPPLDKTAISVTSLGDSSDDDKYWHSRTPEERMRAMEVMRRMVYGEDRTTGRLQRSIEVVDLKQG
ncbi:MAG: hypothetical protein KC978_06850 [Candidatus Omnitrophica bacterium]|nr:hypothetical protein [Candidatus Omnitrophota bacterium]